MRNLLLAVLFMLLPSLCFSGTLYYCTRTGQCLFQSAGQSLIGTSTTNISTAPIQFPAQILERTFWNGTALVGPTPAQDLIFCITVARRQIWELQAQRSQAVSNGGTVLDLALIDRDIELLQRRIVAIQAGR